MELLLWRWSTTAQITSALMIAVFFVVLARSIRRVEMRPWVQAWLANLAALLVTSVFWLAQPSAPWEFTVLRFGYLFPKTLFVAFLAVGAWRFARRRSTKNVSRALLLSIALYSVAGAFLLDTIDKIGLVQSGLMGCFLAASAVLLLVNRAAGSGWLAAGFAIRAALAGVEAIAYGMRVAQHPWATSKGAASKGVGIFLASHSSFDTGAEWVIALGCVLTLYRTIQQELTQANDDLLAAKEVLQELVDSDALTGLSNRRALPEVLRESFAAGATILFFDLNDFKEINDSYGHHVGDDCLKRFARVLQASFLPEDHVIRYAGDEFVVVAQSMDSAAITERIDLVRDRLKFERAGGPDIRFSVGHADLPAGGEPEVALRAADEAMYRDKATKGRVRGARA